MVMVVLPLVAAKVTSPAPVVTRWTGRGDGPRFGPGTHPEDDLWLESLLSGGVGGAGTGAGGHVWAAVMRARVPARVGKRTHKRKHGSEDEDEGGDTQEIASQKGGGGVNGKGKKQPSVLQWQFLGPRNPLLNTCLPS